jgi:hypothetical protein
MTVDGKQITQIGDRLLLLNDSRLRHHRNINRGPFSYVLEVSSEGLGKA